MIIGAPCPSWESARPWARSCGLSASGDLVIVISIQQIIRNSTIINSNSNSNTSNNLWTCGLSASGRSLLSLSLYIYIQICIYIYIYTCVIHIYTHYIVLYDILQCYIIVCYNISYHSISQYGIVYNICGLSASRRVQQQY